MKNKLFKIIGTIFIVLAIFNIVGAIVSISHALSDVTANPQIWIDTAKDVGEGVLNIKAKPILSLIRFFGIIVSVITLAIIALKIMFASLEEKAAYKQKLLPWVAGAMMLFAMTTIPGIIYDVVQSEEVSVKYEEYNLPYYHYCIKGNLMDSHYTGNYMTYTCKTSNCECNDKYKTSFYRLPKV